MVHISQFNTIPDFILACLLEERRKSFQIAKKVSSYYWAKLQKEAVL